MTVMPDTYQERRDVRLHGAQHLRREWFESGTFPVIAPAVRRASVIKRIAPTTSAWDDVVDSPVQRVIGGDHAIGNVHAADRAPFGPADDGIALRHNVDNNTLTFEIQWWIL